LKEGRIVRRKEGTREVGKEGRKEGRIEVRKAGMNKLPLESTFALSVEVTKKS